MRLMICTGPATTGKTSVLRHVIRELLVVEVRPAFLKIDVQHAAEAGRLGREFGIPVRTEFSGDVCPYYGNMAVLPDALQWARRERCSALLVESAGLCLRCAPYVEGALGVVVLEATSGMELPLKVGPMLSMADVAVVTKIDRVSQAEREVFRARIRDAAPSVRIREVNALHGIGIDPLVDYIMDSTPIAFDEHDRPAALRLRGDPPSMGRSE